jgi:predicted TIM-barrel fold metal-dependent hydrolase
MMNTPDNFGELMGNRVLFGTDFFMTEQENRESELFRLAKEHLGDWFDKVSRTNTMRYMGQPV